MADTPVDRHVPLIDVYIFTGVTDFTIDSVQAGRFPTPPAARGFLTDVFDEVGDLSYRIPIDAITSPYLIAGAVFPESPYLEPTIGQIWPRIG